MERITVDHVRALLDAGEDVTIIDSRSADAWNSSDIKAGGALRIPPDAAEKHIADVNRGLPIVVYCT
jgi:rhodanese-related sulfurtransferase